MTLVLNIHSEDFPAVRKFLSFAEQLECKSKYEELRCRLGSSTATLYKSGKLVVQGNDVERVKKAIMELLGEQELILGFDETGRGESTGAFVITAILGQRSRLAELRDSKKTKKISDKYKLATSNSLANCTFSVNAEYIDELRGKGKNMNEIEAIIIDNISKAFEDLGFKGEAVVDGSNLNVKNKKIKFIPKADDKDSVVGAASVVAKHTREISGNKSKRKSWKTHS